MPRDCAKLLLKKKLQFDGLIYTKEQKIQKLLY
jgi:hypothetical protein